MKKIKNYCYYLLATIVISSAISCRNNTTVPAESATRGEPTLSCDTIIYDEESGTFCVTLKADSTAEATLNFQLLMDGDSLLQENSDGKFCHVQPFENGYDVTLRVEWPDTVISRQLHLMGFLVPKEPVEQMSAEELQRLIITKDPTLKRGTNEHLAQSVSLKVTDCQTPPAMLRDVIRLLDSREWESVKVIGVEYDANNLITTITLKPIGVHTPAVDEEDEDYDDEDF